MDKFHFPNDKWKRLISFIFIIMISIFVINNQYVYTSGKSFISSLIQPYDEEEITAEIEKIYNQRSNAFVTGDLNPIKPFFDISHKHGQWSLEHEIKRVKYLRDWAKQREMEFINVESTIRIKKIYPGGPNNVKIALEESYKFDYIYPGDDPQVVNSFGVGIRHTLKLAKKDQRWIVVSDWYTDCFEDALSSYSGTIESNIDLPEDSIIESENSAYTSTLKRPYYNRQKAIEYADKYCGAAWGSSNNFKYNKKYRDFNGIGGDCTNFVSQVLGDKEAGNLPFDGTWHCTYSKYGNGQGSTAWVNADGLKHYLLYSGKGSVIKRGNFKELTTPIQGNTLGAAEKIQPGDVICYEKKGNVDHFAVVTAKDSRGYPLVNSHTTDRYHVPWDLGWGDKGIKFCLIHING